jgi:hypothetical protein
MGPKPKKTKTVGMRLEPEERQRFDALMDLVLRRNPYVSKSDVLRELTGFTDTGLLREEERMMIRPPGRHPRFAVAESLSGYDPSGGLNDAVTEDIRTTVKEPGPRPRDKKRRKAGSG